MQNNLCVFDMDKCDELFENIINIKNNFSLIANVDEKNIALYGAGNLGILATDLLAEAKIVPKNILDRDPKKWGQKIRNVEIVSPEAIGFEDKINTIVAVSIVNYPFYEIKSYLNLLGYQKVVPFYDIAELFKERIRMTNGWILSPLNDNNKSEIRIVYNSFSDRISKALYVQVLYWRINRQEVIFDNAKVTVEDKFFPLNLMPKLSSREFYMDCGAYNGETIKRFLMETNGQIAGLIAFEPDKDNFNDLINFISSEKLNEISQLYPFGVGKQKRNGIFLSGRGMAGKFDNNVIRVKVPIVPIDSVVGDNHVTFIKIHVEGAEYDALLGAMNTIIKNRPILVVTIYHNEEGLWKVPQLLMKNLNDYLFYHRLHAYCGIESVFYAFPKERME